MGKARRARQQRQAQRATLELQQRFREVKQFRDQMQADANTAEQEAETAPVIWIRSRPPRRPLPGETAVEGGYNTLPYCEVTWGQVSWFAPLKDVRQTAQDLFTAASYADMIRVLLRAGAEPQMVTGLLTQTMRRRLGCATTLALLPTGSSEHGEGMVRLQHSSRIGMITPDGAREMGQSWLTVAIAVEQDTLLHEVLSDAAGLDDSARDKVLGYMEAVRTDPDAATRDLQAAEQARLAAMFAEHPGVTETDEVGWERPLHFLDEGVDPRPEVYRYGGTGVGVRHDLLDTVLHQWAQARETARTAGPGTVDEVEEMARTLIVAALGTVDDDPAREQLDKLTDYLRGEHEDVLAESGHRGKGPADAAIRLLRGRW